MEDVQTAPTIFVIDEDTFEAGYVSSMLENLDVNVLYHTRSSNALEAILKVSTIRTAIVGTLLGSTDVINELKIRKLPVLLLIKANDGLIFEKNGVSILAKPFAAYQVADWVSKTLNPS